MPGFVNAVANARTSLTLHSVVHLRALNGASFASSDAKKSAVVGVVESRQVDWGLVAQLGPIQHGQNRDLVVYMNVPDSATLQSKPYLEATLEFEGNKLTTTGDSRKPTADAIAALVRSTTVVSILVL